MTHYLYLTSNYEFIVTPRTNIQIVTRDKLFLESLWKVRGKFLESSQIFARFV
jgi:hypothetical protein